MIGATSYCNNEMLEVSRRLQSIYLPEYTRRPTATTATTTTPVSSSNIVSPTQSALQRNKVSIRLVPHIGLTDQCFVFDVVDCELERGGVPLKIGRYSARTIVSDRISFKSKVVSRFHAEIWLSNYDGKIYIKDAGSSTGTFVNHVRLSPNSMESVVPHELKDGDLIQLGVDYSSGYGSAYRAVRIRFEVGRQSPSISTFQKNNFQQILTGQIAHQDCSICLYRIVPFQALFVAPCSHMYHYKCLKPVLTQNYPGFSCPLCRTYSNLEANVFIEKESVSRLLEQEEAVISCENSSHEVLKLSSVLMRRPVSSANLFGEATQHLDTGETESLFQEEEIQ